MALILDETLTEEVALRWHERLVSPFTPTKSVPYQGAIRDENGDYRIHPDMAPFYSITGDGGISYSEPQTEG